MEGKSMRHVRMMRPLEFLEKAKLSKDTASLETRDDPKVKILRLPEALHTQLVRLAGELTANAGKRVSVNRVIVEILEQFFKHRGNKTG